MGPTQMQGEIWDEKGLYQIVEIFISHQQDLIKSIQFTYCIDERAVHSQNHGEPNGLKFNMVKFDYPHELLTSVSGAYKDGKLASITFGTNKKKYGPFGRIGNRPSSSSYEDFKYEFEAGRFDGSHGSVCDESVTGSRPSSNSYEDFEYEFEAGRFGGFHGSVSDGSVYAIGVYVKPIQIVTLDEYYDAILEERLC